MDSINLIKEVLIRGLWILALPLILVGTILLCTFGILSDGAKWLVEKMKEWLEIESMNHDK